MPSEGCGPIVGFPAGAIALVDRGNCNFADKTLNAQHAGAVAVVIVNNVPAPRPPPAERRSGHDDPDRPWSARPTAPRQGGPAGERHACFGATATSNASRVVLTSRAWGHEGGNDIKAAVREPGVAANSPLTVSALGNEITVSLATNASGALSSTAAQVVAAINANPARKRARQGAHLPEQRGHRASSRPR